MKHFCRCRFIEIPSFFHVMASASQDVVLIVSVQVVHVEQECSGDDRTALQTVLEVS